MRGRESDAMVTMELSGVVFDASSFFHDTVFSVFFFIIAWLSLTVKLGIG